MLQPWVITYRPASLKVFGTHKQAIIQMQQFVKDFKKQRKKAMLLHGPTGSGKTAAVYALASDNKFEIIEVNASDVRKKEDMLSLLGVASTQRSLFSKSKIILIDEIDCVSGVKDRGALGAVEQIIEKTAFPIFLTCHDVTDKKIKSLLKKVQSVAFVPLDHTDVFSVLHCICLQEKIQYDMAALKTLARQVGGDLRAAINDLQSLSQQRGKITMEALDVLGYRNKQESIQEAMLKIFKVGKADVALSALDNIHEDLDQVMLWVDHNIPREYLDGPSLVRAYDTLSKADVYRGRIRRWQHWRFLVYVNILLSAGVAVAKDKRNKEHVSYEQTKRLLKIWLARQKYAKQESVAAKIAAKTHSSTRYCVQYTVPYLQFIFQNNKRMSAAISNQFELDPDEISWLRK